MYLIDTLFLSVGNGDGNRAAVLNPTNGGVESVLSLIRRRGGNDVDVTLPNLGTDVRRVVVAVEVGLYKGYDLPTSSVEDDLICSSHFGVAVGCLILR